MPEADVVVIGAGQAGLSVGRLLSRSDLSFVILDAEERPGAAWRHAWDSLRLFSPAFWSSIPGIIFPGGRDYYPNRDEVIDYFATYEERYRLPIERPVLVDAVRPYDDEYLRVETDREDWLARRVVSATGSWRKPVIPDIPGRELFEGVQMHSACYRSPVPFRGQRVLVVGGGNSGAQIHAELSLVADSTWATRREPRFLPDDVDGRALFDRATVRYQAREEGHDPDKSVENLLGDIVMLPPVKAARDRGDLVAARMFERLTRDGVVWPDGREELIDAVIWCTGFRPALDHLTPLGVSEPDGRILTDGTRSVREPRLWLVGYGEWTGYASATLIGVGRTSKAAVEGIVESLE
ncbi:ArsO family NAD(P)H-dependent flavin-containing monooxygenase [soil metagenome]